MRLIYTIIYIISLPFLLLILKKRVRRTKQAQFRLAECFGYYATPALERSIWLHAVSLGESITAVPLIEAILKNIPDYPLVVTYSTPTADVYMQEHFKDKVIAVYLPVDLPVCFSRFFKHFKPRLGILMEKELWPNLLASCQHYKIPLLLANARLSQRAVERYLKIKNFVRRMLQALTFIAAQTAADATHFEQLGMASNKIGVVGNLKFDLQIPTDTFQRAHDLRLQWGQNRPIFIAGSVHAGEEEIILEAFGSIRKECPDALLVLVPRHPERFLKVAKLCEQQNFKLARISQHPLIDRDTAILLGDVTGQLLPIYAAGDVC